MKFPLKFCAILLASTHLSFLPFCQPQNQQQEHQSTIMPASIHERTYIMVKVWPPCPPSLIDLLTRCLISSHRSPTASSEVSSETSSVALRSVVSSSSPSSSFTLPLHTLRSVSLVTVVHAYRRPKLTHLDLPSADYEDLKEKPFFPGLIKYMASGPVVAMVWQGLDAVKTGRAMLGATNPLASAPGSLLNSGFPLALIRECTSHPNYRYYPWRLCPRCWPQHLPRL
jgi:hypothetical protein